MENVKVIQERENPLFSRKEIILEIKKETIPNQKEIKLMISKTRASRISHFKTVLDKVACYVVSLLSCFKIFNITINNAFNYNYKL